MLKNYIISEDQTEHCKKILCLLSYNLISLKLYIFNFIDEKVKDEYKRIYSDNSNSNNLLIDKLSIFICNFYKIICNNYYITLNRK